MRFGKGAMVLVGLSVACSFLSGCKDDARVSQGDVQELKKGPPREMPPQARKMMEDASKAGHGPGAPGQPGASGAGAPSAPQ